MSTKWPYEFPGAYWIDKEEETAVLNVLRKGSMFRYYGIGEPDYTEGKGKPSYVDSYESAAREFYGAKYALGVNSGTGALIIAMRALGIGPGCEVIVPAFMWVATVGAVVQTGAIPVLCEIDESFNMDTEDLARKITPRTRLIIPIHIAGAPCNMDAIMEVAQSRNIPVLEDCAQCNGGQYKDRKVGTFGDMGIFSLQLNKNMTSGEGGLIITNDEKLYTRAFSAHDMGLIRVNGRLAAPEPDAILWGGGRRMSELCGAVASVQLKKLPEITGKMLSSKCRIKEMLGSIEGLKFRKIHDEKGDTGPFLIIVMDNKKKAVNAAQKMKESGLHSIFRIADYGLHIYYNIPALVNKIPLSPPGNPWTLEANAGSNYEYKKGQCPVSDDLFARSILIPIPSCLSEEQEEWAVKIIKNAVAEKEKLS